MNKTILFLKADKHEYFTLSLYFDGVIYNKTYKCPIGTMSDILLKKCDLLLSQHRIALTNIDAFVVFLGPGSYTSLRIAISTANALAFALNKPIIGIKKQQLFDKQIIDKINWKKSFTKPVDAYYQQVI
jgi:tRNA A37 threonylcarbamoyladenosine modification protein TsaB